MPISSHSSDEWQTGGGSAQSLRLAGSIGADEWGALSEHGFARGRLAVTVSELGGQFLIALSGEADAATADELRASLEDVLDQGASDLVLDLAELELLDSSGLGVLVGVLKRINERQGRMLLRSPRGTTRRVFEITGLDQVFSIAD